LKLLRESRPGRALRCRPGAHRPGNTADTLLNCSGLLSGRAANNPNPRRSLKNHVLCRRSLSPFALEKVVLSMILSLAMVAGLDVVAWRGKAWSIAWLALAAVMSVAPE